jgi:hypothetical protein
MKQGHRKHERGGGDSHEIPSCELGQFSDFIRGWETVTEYDF